MAISSCRMDAEDRWRRSLIGHMNHRHSVIVEKLSTDEVGDAPSACGGYGAIFLLARTEKNCIAVHTTRNAYSTKIVSQPNTTRIV